MRGAARCVLRGGWLLVLFILSLARPARAESTLDLAWTAPSSCPERAWVVANVKRLVTTMPAEPLHVDALAHEEEGRWTVELSMHGAASGTRTLRAATCSSVARATALIIALALDPQAATLAAGELAKADTAPEPVAAEPMPAPPANAPELREPIKAHGPRVFARLGGGLESGLLPGVAAGAELGFGIAWRALRFDLRAQLAPSTSTELARAPTVGAEFSAISIALRGCAGRDIGRLGIAGCAALRSVAIAGEGRGATENYRERGWVMAVEPGVLFRVPATGALAIEIDLAAVLPLNRPEFIVSSRTASERLFRVAAVGGRGVLAASFRF